jgi:phosphoribosylanthranilate isomerase
VDKVNNHFCQGKHRGKGGKETKEENYKQVQKLPLLWLSTISTNDSQSRQDKQAELCTEDGIGGARREKKVSNGCNFDVKHKVMNTWVKICGITNLEDAQTAVDAGADALGFIFYAKSPRKLTIPAVAEIVKHLPPVIMRVGVFVNALKMEVDRAVGECGLSMLQFHGNEPPEYCTQFGLMSMKAFRIKDAESLKGLPNFSTHAWLLDAFSPEVMGGTGETFNWDLAVEARKFGKPIFLAGGLTPENVAEAIYKVRPFGVDVSSGVEKSTGKKDHEKVRAFIKAAKTVGN